MYFQSRYVQSVGTHLVGSDRNVRYTSSHHKGGFIGWAPAHFTDSGDMENHAKSGAEDAAGTQEQLEPAPLSAAGTVPVFPFHAGSVSLSSSRSALPTWQKP